MNKQKVIRLRLPSAISLLFLAVMLFGCGKAEKVDLKQITNCFDSYKTAVLNGDGKSAVACVNHETIDYFSKMLGYVVFGAKSEIQGLRVSDKILVLRARHQVEFQKLTEMSGEDFFAYGVDAGWTGKNSVLDMGMGKVQADENIAKGQMIIAGKPAPAPNCFSFSKEGDAWKLNLMPLLIMGDVVLKEHIRQQNITDDQFVFDIIESLSGKKVTEEIWIPIREVSK